MEFTQDVYQGGIQAPGNEAGLSQGHGQSGHEGSLTPELLRASRHQLVLLQRFVYPASVIPY